jgi:hypothetical protein
MLLPESASDGSTWKPMKQGVKLTCETKDAKGKKH